MADGYSRWKQDFNSKEPLTVDTNTFYRKCPACEADLTIRLKDEQMDNGTFERTLDTVEGQKVTKESQTRLGGSQEAAEASKSSFLKKCAYCFRDSIRGGVLCREHSFCFGDKHGPTDVVFPDGKPYELKERPLCESCAK